MDTSSLTYSVHWQALGSKFVKSGLDLPTALALIEEKLKEGYSFEVVSKRKES